MDNLGKTFIRKDGQLGKLISITDKPSFTIDMLSGERVSATQDSPLGAEWKLARADEMVTERSIDTNKIDDIGILAGAILELNRRGPGNLCPPINDALKKVMERHEIK